MNPMNLTEHFIEWLANNVEPCIAACAEAYDADAAPVFHEAITLMLLTGKPHFVDTSHHTGKPVVCISSVLNYEIVRSYVGQTHQTIYTQCTSPKTN